MPIGLILKGSDFTTGREWGGGGAVQPSRRGSLAQLPKMEMGRKGESSQKRGKMSQSALARWEFRHAGRVLFCSPGSNLEDDKMCL